MKRENASPVAVREMFEVSIGIRALRPSPSTMNLDS